MVQSTRVRHCFSICCDTCAHDRFKSSRIETQFVAEIVRERERGWGLGNKSDDDDETRVSFKGRLLTVLPTDQAGNTNAPRVEGRSLVNDEGPVVSSRPVVVKKSVGVLTQFRWCDFGSRERFDLRRAPDPSRPPPGRRRNILKRQAS